MSMSQTELTGLIYRLIIDLNCYKNVNGVIHMKNRKNSLKLASVLLGSTLVLGACSNPFNSLADNINGWLSGEESAEEESTEEETSENTSEDTQNEASDTEQSDAAQSETESTENETEQVDYSHLMDKGEETTLEDGTYEVGNDVPAGRYVMTADTGIGNVFISNEEDRTILSTTLNGTEESERYGSGKVIAFLEEGNSIEIEGLEGVNFTPYEAEEVTELFPGMWVVGTDFPAGVYDISMEETDYFGSMEVYSHPDATKARYSLGDPEYGGMTEFTASFEEGDIVELKNISTVKINKRD